MSFDALLEAVEKDLVIVESACQETKGSISLKNIFTVILTIGNFMNGGTNKGDAGGFHLSTLNQLKGTKSADNSTSLLTYVVQVVQKLKDPGNLSAELCHITAASRIESQLLELEVTKIGRDVERLANSLKLADPKTADSEKKEYESDLKKKEERRKKKAKERELKEKERTEKEEKDKKEREAKKKKEKQARDKNREKAKKERDMAIADGVPDDQLPPEPEPPSPEIKEEESKPSPPPPEDPNEEYEIRDYAAEEDKFNEIMEIFSTVAQERYSKLVGRLKKLITDCDDLVVYFGSPRGTEKWEEFFTKFDSFILVYVQAEKQLEKIRAQLEKEAKKAAAEAKKREQLEAKNKKAASGSTEPANKSQSDANSRKSIVGQKFEKIKKGEIEKTS